MAPTDAIVARVRHVLRSRPGRRRVVAFVALLVVYLAVTLGVIYRTPLLTLDTDVFKLDLHHRYPEWKHAIKIYVMLGQRGPATLLFLPWFCWVAWRNRTPRPLIALALALVLLNLSVGVVKLATGRLGPLQTSNTHRIFDGGNIYPSGHVSNAVVLYGLIAMIAVNHRRLAAVVATTLAVTVGLGTVYRDTHWFSDVLGGWIAGGLVLIALPWAMPFADRAFAWVWARLATHLPKWLQRLARGAPESGARPAGAHPVGAPDVGTRPVGTHPVAAHPVATHPVGARLDDARPDAPSRTPAVPHAGVTRPTVAVSRPASSPTTVSTTVSPAVVSPPVAPTPVVATGDPLRPPTRR